MSDDYTMKDRIIQIMTSEGLMPSRFAEEIGIQRAAMSHITSGRNNPSLDVVTKILERFPSINPNWLLFGTGDMKSNDPLNNSGRISFSSPTLPDNSPGLFANPSDIRPQKEKKTEYRTDLRDTPPSQTVQQFEKKTIITDREPSKKIEKITIFYSDNTYEVFIPEKQG